MKTKNRILISLFAFLLSGMQSCSSKQPETKSQVVMEAGEIMDDLKAGKNVVVENKTINGEIDFTIVSKPVKETPGLNRVYVNSSITFISCIFNGKITGYKSTNDLTTLCDFSKSISFTDCEFKEDFSLRESIFHGNVYFNKSFCMKKSSFEGSRFWGDALFMAANFGDEARFQNIFFYNKCNFMDAVFGKTTYFQSCVFFGDAQFSTTRWDAYADLSLCIYHGGCFFNYAVFNDRSVFSNCRFNGRAEFYKATFTGNSEFKNCTYFGNVKMHEAVVNALLDLSGSGYITDMPDTASFHKSGNTKILMERVKSGMIK